MGLRSRHLEEAEGPLGTGWPVWRQRCIGRQAACPVTVLLPSQPACRGSPAGVCGSHTSLILRARPVPLVPLPPSEPMWVARPRLPFLAAGDERAHATSDHPQPVGRVPPGPGLGLV